MTGKQHRRRALQQVLLALKLTDGDGQGFKVLGLDPTPELLAISMVYFVQGILGLSRLAISFFFKDELQLEPADVAFITGLAGLPWMVKPLYGFISDSMPLWGYHRRSYLVLAGLTGTAAWMLLCFAVQDSWSASAAMIATSLSTAVSDVLVDSLVVERARDAPQAVAGSLQSLCWGSAAVGGIVSAYWSGSLVESLGTRAVFGITALFPLIVSCSALLIDEQRVTAHRHTRSGHSHGSKAAEQGCLPGTGAQWQPPLSGMAAAAVVAEADQELDALRRSGRSPSESPPPGRGEAGAGGAVLVGVHPLPPPPLRSGAGVHHRHRSQSPRGQRGRLEGLQRPGGAHAQEHAVQRGSGDAGGPSERALLLVPQHCSAAAGGVGGSWQRGTVGSGSGAWGQVVARGRMLWQAISRRDILLPSLFVFVWQATPSADSAMFFFQTNELGFEPEFLGRVRLVGSMASLAGVALYNTSLKRVPLRTILWWAMLLGTMLGSTQLLLVSRANLALGLSDQLFVLGDAALLTALGQATFLPILVLAARLCPEGVEATLFATLMSVLNAGSFLGSALGAGLTKLLGVTSTDFTHLFALVAMCNAAQLLPAPLLCLIPESLDRPEDESTTSGDEAGDVVYDTSGKAGVKAAQARGGTAAEASRDIELKDVT